MPHFDIDWVRSQFPALAQTADGLPFTYLDAPGGTQVPRSVLTAISDSLVRANSNTHGAFLTSKRVDEAIEQAHAALADFLGARPTEVVFGPNMTTLTLALSRAFGRTIEPGDEIIVTRLDHEANVSPWKALAEQCAVIREIDIREEDCTLNTDALVSAINEKTRLVAVGYASNAVGSINPLRRIIDAAHSVGALVFVDAVHYAPHGPIDVKALDCDFLACSTYKFFGPHQGVLYGKQEHLEHLVPYKLRVSTEELPYRWETGTQSHEAMAGAAAAVEYLMELGQHHAAGFPSTRRAALAVAMESIRHYEAELGKRLIAGLLDIPAVTFYGIREPQRTAERTPTVSIRHERGTPLDLAAHLGRQHIFTWDGNYYALSLSERLDVESSGGMVRIGLVHYNTEEEVDRCLNAISDFDG